MPKIAKNVFIWGRHHRTKVDPGVTMSYFCALRAQKYGIFTRVNFCTMVTPPNANIFGTLPYATAILRITLTLMSKSFIFASCFAEVHSTDNAASLIGQREVLVEAQDRSLRER